MTRDTVERPRMEAITRLLADFGAGKFDSAMEQFTGDVVMNIPFQDTSAGFWSHVEGKDGLRRLFASIPRLFHPHELHLDEILHASDGRTVVARYHGEFVVRATGKPYRNTYVAIFEFDGDRISSWTEFHNPQVLGEALRA